MSSSFRVTYTHLAIWTKASWIAARLCDTIFLKNVTHLESDRKGFGAYFYKIIRLYFYVVINAYVYKDIEVYLYVNTRMCLCVNMRTH